MKVREQIMTDEERKEFNDLKERVEFLEYTVRNQTALITKITDHLYVIAKIIKEDKK